MTTRGLPCTASSHQRVCDWNYVALPSRYRGWLRPQGPCGSCPAVTRKGEHQLLLRLVLRGYIAHCGPGVAHDGVQNAGLALPTQTGRAHSAGDAWGHTGSSATVTLPTTCHELLVVMPTVSCSTAELPSRLLLTWTFCCIQWWAANPSVCSWTACVGQMCLEGSSYGHRHQRASSLELGGTLCSPAGWPPSQSAAGPEMRACLIMQVPVVLD